MKWRCEGLYAFGLISAARVVISRLTLVRALRLSMRCGGLILEIFSVSPITTGSLYQAFLTSGLLVKADHGHLRSLFVIEAAGQALLSEASDRAATALLPWAQKHSAAAIRAMAGDVYLL